MSASKRQRSEDADSQHHDDRLIEETSSAALRGEDTQHEYQHQHQSTSMPGQPHNDLGSAEGAHGAGTASQSGGGDDDEDSSWLHGVLVRPFKFGCMCVVKDAVARMPAPCHQQFVCQTPTSRSHNAVCLLAEPFNLCL